jgi:Uncharacterized protein conserved in bacteria (DUF2314)
MGVAAALADGAAAGPIALSSEGVTRASGATTSGDAGAEAIAVDVVAANAEAGDPNDFMLRIEPPAGDGPMGYVDLAERFFGPVLSTPPDADASRHRQDDIRDRLGATLARGGDGAFVTHDSDPSGHLFARLPFAIPGEGDAGVESMWIEITRYDATTVTGKLVDDPLGATDVARGDEVTRPRNQVEDVRSGE